MGYCMWMGHSTAVLPAANEAEAMKRMEVLDRTGSKHGGSSDGRSWFSWVDEDWLKNSADMVDVFTEWRYQTIRTDEGDIEINGFDGEKLGDDEQLWEALSDLMTGEIHMTGEDGYSWGWKFGGPTLIEGRSVIVYPGG